MAELLILSLLSGKLCQGGLTTEHHTRVTRAKHASRDYLLVEVLQPNESRLNETSLASRGSLRCATVPWLIVSAKTVGSGRERTIKV